MTRWHGDNEIFVGKRAAMLTIDPSCATASLEQLISTGWYLFPVSLIAAEFYATYWSIISIIIHSQPFTVIMALMSPSFLVFFDQTMWLFSRKLCLSDIAFWQNPRRRGYVIGMHSQPIRNRIAINRSSPWRLTPYNLNMEYYWLKAFVMIGRSLRHAKRSAIVDCPATSLYEG